MSNLKLSYVLTTFNKLPYLKQAMRLLLKNVQHDEEIVIVDGGSTDGTKEYLLDLFNCGLIHQFISEKDNGEAHGYNKSLFLARGDLIKVITDDDVFNYSHIKLMKEFMLKNPEVDVLTGNIISVNVINSITYLEWRKSYQVWFQKWINKEFNNTFFSCLPLLVRRSSLSLLGLFDTSYKHVDLEYSIRITSHNRKVAFFTGIVAIGLVNEQSVSAQVTSYTSVLEEELKRLKGNFNYIHKQGIENIHIPWMRKNIFQKHTILWKLADKFKLFLTKEKRYCDFDVKLTENITIPNKDIDSLFKFFEKYLNELVQFEIPEEFLKSYWD